MQNCTAEKRFSQKKTPFLFFQNQSEQSQNIRQTRGNSVRFLFPALLKKTTCTKYQSFFQKMPAGCSRSSRTEAALILLTMRLPPSLTNVLKNLKQLQKALFKTRRSDKIKQAKTIPFAKNLKSPLTQKKLSDNIQNITWGPSSVGRAYGSYP